jgi:hypothetical protein
MTRTSIAASPFRPGVAQQLIGAATAAAGNRDHLGRGHRRPAGAFAGDQRAHLGPRIRCGRWVLVRIGGAALRQGRSEHGRTAVAVAAGRAIEREARGVGGRLGRGRSPSPLVP